MPVVWRLLPVSARDGGVVRVERDLQEFIRARYPVLLRRAYLLTHDHHAAEDLVQEALARSCRAWGRQAADNPDAYVARVMVNLHISQWRRRRPAEASTAVLPEVSVSDGTQERSEADQVWRALADTPPRQRAVLVLRYYEGMTESEAAQVLGVTVGTVRSQTSKALGPAPVQAIDARARQLSNRHRLAALAAVGVVAVAGVASALALGQNTGRAPLLPGGASPTVTSGTAASSCGAWDRSGSTFADVVQAYGGIVSCFRYDGASVGWVITTDGTAGQPAVVGIDWCVDGTAACLNGSQDHTNDLWTYYPATSPGSIRLAARPIAGYPLALTVGGKQQSFDPATAAYGDIEAFRTPSAPFGMLVSGIVMAGGPPRHVAASPSALGYATGNVRLSRGGRIVAETHLDQEPWQLPLAPGTYTLSSAGGCPSATVHITTGLTTHADVTCNVA